jgi:tol-pal system protein YbgF
MRQPKPVLSKPFAPRPLLWTLALAALASGPARAGLFDDEEARKAILDLRARIQQSDDAQRVRVEALSRQLGEVQGDQLGTLRRSVLDLGTQNETLRAELAKLRGQNEQLARDLAEVQRKQTDLTQGMDDRLRKMEPQKIVVDGKEVLADPEEKRLYEAAMAAVRNGDFVEAANALTAFQKRYPGSGFGDSVRFWLGNAYYGKRDYKDAVATFRAFITTAPEHPRAPEAMLALANCQAELKDMKSARRTLDELLRTYPKSEAAQAGKERLATLR